MQSRIYESDSFYKFMRNERRRLMSLAKNYKRQAITFRFNNWKIQKIVGLQQKKLSIYKGVAELKMKLQIWQRLVGLTSLQ